MANMKRDILKIGAAITKDGELLIVKEFGDSTFILPGGRPEKGESDLATLKREIGEELGCTIGDNDEALFLGSFSDVAATDPDMTVTVRLYSTMLKGSIAPRGEIEEVRWYCPKRDNQQILAPSIRNKILPFLISKGVV